MNSKKISVIVAIYNVEKYLKKCLDSIINQSYNNLEIILIDDGSTDKCGIICDEYGNLDERIIVVHKKNEGLSSARNIGLDIASGNLISFVDGDDYIEYNMLEELKKNMDKYDSDISICNYYYEKNNNRKIINSFSKIEFVSKGKNKFKNIQNEYGQVTVYAWNKLYKKKIFNDIRYPVGKIFEDSYILCDILNKSNKVSYILKPLYNYVYRRNSIVNKFSINHFNKVESFDKKIEYMIQNNYYDLAYEEKKRKMDYIIVCLSQMKRNRIDNKKIKRKYYLELVNLNKEIKWKKSNKNIKKYKIFKRFYIEYKGCKSLLKDKIIKILL